MKCQSAFSSRCISICSNIHTTDGNSFDVCEKVMQKLQMGFTCDAGLLNHHLPSQSQLIHSLSVCLFQELIAKCLSTRNSKPA